MPTTRKSRRRNSRWTGLWFALALSVLSAEATAAEIGEEPHAETSTTPKAKLNTTLKPRVHAADDVPLLANYRFWRADERTRLPKRLREISGLTVIEDGVVALHHDNRSLVWHFDYRSSQLSPTPVNTGEDNTNGRKGDYEGIATLGNRLLLTTSHADLLLLTPPSNDRGGRKPESLRTNFHRHCNFEGLALLDVERATPIALLPCKYPKFEAHGRAPAEDHLVYLFRHALGDPAHSPADKSADSLEPLTIDVTPILRQIGKRRLRPSAVEVVGDRLLVLAGKERVLLEATHTGELMAWRRLWWPRHRQAEGLTLGTDGSLIIADEGRWLGGTIAVYQPINASTNK